ncbi:hypothetical protein BLA29_009573, partial [Euroglyphus maynei]
FYKPDVFGDILVNDPIDEQKELSNNLKQVACSKFHDFSFAYDGSLYYAWGKINDDICPSFIKLNGQPKSFAAASALVLQSPITFGLTSTKRQSESNDQILKKSIFRLFDNPDNYDVEFVIGDKRILACKCYLKTASEYYNRMFSGDWRENNTVIIDAYSYDTYYAYLNFLHDGCIRIDENNIAELSDLANCYGDERLKEQCETFIWNDLNERTLRKYFPLIVNYELIEVQAKLVDLTIDEVLPKMFKKLK